MSDMVIYIIGLAAIITIIASLWYLIQTVKIMWGYSSLWAVLAVLFNPIVQIVFYFIPKDTFFGHEKLMFKRYFLSLLVMTLLGVCAAVVIPAIEEKQYNALSDEIDNSQPWDWDIRAENQEEVLAATDAESNNEKVAKLHFDAIYQTHPDADEIISSPEYALWVQEKPEEDKNYIAEVMREGTSTEVIYVLSLFKKDLEAHKNNNYQVRRDNAQALAQVERQEKQSRDIASQAIRTQKELDAQQQQYQQTSNQVASQPSVRQAPAKRNLTYGERQERERLKATLSTPMKGANGNLTRSQIEGLVALETGQPMPARSQSAGGSTTNPTPSNMASCDGAGCWDTSGVRYNKGAGDTYFPSIGGSCQNVGGQMQCN